MIIANVKRLLNDTSSKVNGILKDLYNDNRMINDIKNNNEISINNNITEMVNLLKSNIDLQNKFSFIISDLEKDKKNIIVKYENELLILQNDIQKIDNNINLLSNSCKKSDDEYFNQLRHKKKLEKDLENIRDNFLNLEFMISSEKKHKLFSSFELLEQLSLSIFKDTKYDIKNVDKMKNKRRSDNFLLPFNIEQKFQYVKIMNMINEYDSNNTISYLYDEYKKIVYKIKNLEYKLNSERIILNNSQNDYQLFCNKFSLLEKNYNESQKKIKKLDDEKSLLNQKYKTIKNEINLLHSHNNEPYLKNILKNKLSSLYNNNNAFITVFYEYKTFYELLFKTMNSFKIINILSQYNTNDFYDYYQKFSDEVEKINSLNSYLNNIPNNKNEVEYKKFDAIHDELQNFVEKHSNNEAYLFNVVNVINSLNKKLSDYILNTFGFSMYNVKNTKKSDTVYLKNIINENNLNIQNNSLSFVLLSSLFIDYESNITQILESKNYLTSYNSSNCSSSNCSSIMSDLSSFNCSNCSSCSSSSCSSSCSSCGSSCA